VAAKSSPRRRPCWPAYRVCW